MKDLLDRIGCFLLGHTLEEWTDPATGRLFEICLHCGFEQ
jgi:hypothetical protein